MKSLLKALLVLVLSFIFVSPTEAHVLKSDKTIGSVIHINPDDDPIVGETANIYLDVKDKTNKFSLKECNCLVTISSDNTIIHTQEFTNSSSTNPSFEYVFPEVGVYEIVLTGSPLSEGAFDSFKHSFTFRVSRTQDHSMATSDKPGSVWYEGVHVVHYIGVGIVVVLFIGMLIKQSLDKKKSQYS